MNRNIIIVLIIIFLIILAGIITFSQFATKSDSQINFLSNASLKNGDSVEFQLTDSQGNAIANQNLTISFGANGTHEQYSVITDGNGKGALLLNDEPSGNYEVTVNFAGSEQYNECSASQNITISGDNSQTSAYASSGSGNGYSNNAASTSSSNSAQSASQQSSQDTTYDSELNVYYDSEGKIVGGQNDGANYEDVKNNPPQVDSEGNLV